jgi:hypothetical protein
MSRTADISIALPAYEPWRPVQGEHIAVFGLEANPNDPSTPTDSAWGIPGGTFGPLAGKLKHDGASDIDPALGLKHGSLQVWKEGLKNPCRYSDYLIFAVSVAFSGPLFDLAGEQEGIVFHYQPENSAPENKVTKTKSWSTSPLASINPSQSGPCLG